MEEFELSDDEDCGRSMASCSTEPLQSPKTMKSTKQERQFESVNSEAAKTAETAINEGVEAVQIQKNRSAVDEKTTSLLSE